MGDRNISDHIRDVIVAAEVLRKADPKALYAAAQVYYQDSDAPWFEYGIHSRHPETGDRLMLMAAESGLAQAQYEWARHYGDTEQGQAAQWYIKAANQGHEKAAHALVAMAAWNNIGPAIRWIEYAERRNTIAQQAIKSEWWLKMMEINRDQQRVIESEDAKVPHMIGV